MNLLNNQRIQEDISVLKKFQETIENEDTSYQTVWNTAKVIRERGHSSANTNHKGRKDLHKYPNSTA